jgi:hypothetical protein
MKQGRRVLIGTAVVTALLASGSTAATAASAPQSTAARFTADATQYQNSIIAGAMTKVPQGTRVSAGRVEWGDGAATLIVPASADVESDQVSCPAADVCVFTGTWWTGSELEIDDLQYGNADHWIRVGAALPAEESVINAIGFRYWMEQYQDSGNELCIDPDTYYPDVNSANDHDYWGLTTGNFNDC